MVDIAAAVKVSKDCKSFFPAVFGGEPTWGIREEKETKEEDGTRNRLDTYSKVSMELSLNATQPYPMGYGMRLCPEVRC